MTVLRTALLATLGMAVAVPSAAQERQPSTAEARKALAVYGACLADRSPERSADALRHFKTPRYARVLDTLAKANDDCVQDFAKSQGPYGGSMRGHDLLFAGTISERLLERNGAPLKPRLAQIAARPPIDPVWAGDPAIICTLRSDPDSVAGLLQTEIASAEEATAIGRLQPLVSACARAGQGNPIEINGEGLRAALAFAAYRSAVAEPAQMSNR